MSNTLKVVGIGGSLSQTSTSRAALVLALDGAAQAGAQTRLFDVRELDLPLYNPDMTDIPQRAHEYAEAVCEAQALIWSSPLYHGTVSGAFKNALDWLQLLSGRTPAFLTDKVIGLISTAGGTQGLQAINTMEFCVRALRGWAVPLVLPIAKAGQAFDDDGVPREAGTTQQLYNLGREVVRAAQQFGTDGYCDYSVPYAGIERSSN